ncbi:MAG TPA: hypothetical protein VFT53_00430 [Candidatus Saccharimonadales bacterium]|nr:hypothetical protein [Candidatus Saccharimonadales bacterium]
MFWEDLLGHVAKRQQSLAEADSLVNVVIAEAELVSNVAAVDPLLDQVRAITAKLGPNEPPSPAQEETLLGVYLDIETYLATRDPIRHFSKTDIRKHLRPALCRRIEQYEAKEGVHA